MSVKNVNAATVKENLTVRAWDLTTDTLPSDACTRQLVSAAYKFAIKAIERR
jgi:hypothetical protein